MTLLSIGIILYVVLLILVCLRIIYDTKNTTKTVAYLLVAIFIPVFGILLYFTFGINYRKHKLFSEKIANDQAMMKKLKENIMAYTKASLQRNDPALQDNEELANLLLNDIFSPLTSRNQVKLLVNGENKFKEVLTALKEAKHHIHIAYYIYKDDIIGKKIEDILIQKAKEGVQVRFIYDDFGSRSIRKTLVRRLREAGVQAYPFFKVLFILLANRLNYRNHRKIIIIDGQTAFVGGINVSDAYINNEKDQKKLFWRDTHMRIDGPGVYYLQYLFLTDWNFSSEENVQPNEAYFPEPKTEGKGAMVQIASSGPDSTYPTILYSLLAAMALGKKEILITTPYFIPGESMLDAITIAALSGLKIKILVPLKCDIPLVNAAARSYYEDLLNAGVEIYLYQKGFVHAKSVVVDGNLAIVGTANMDFRSFDLNFEVNAIVYDEKFAGEVRDVFYEDLKFAKKIDPEAWRNRHIWVQLGEKVARLFSPIL